MEFSGKKISKPNFIFHLLFFLAFVFAFTLNSSKDVNARCSYEEEAECDANPNAFGCVGGCPGGYSCKFSYNCCFYWPIYECVQSCNNWNEPVGGGGCCPGLASWEGLCCNWGQDVDCGTCHGPCPSGQHYDCIQGCVHDCECTSNTWYNVGSCPNCGTNQRLCGSNCLWTDRYQCANPGPCSPGEVSYGGGCGSCGTWRRDCAGNCQWGGWYCCCGNPSAGQSCNCGPCGCGGTIQCNGACSGHNPKPGNYGDACNCGPCGCGGTIQCNGACSGANPKPGNYGDSCNCNGCGCGGSIQCNGACSGGPNPPPNECGTCGPLPSGYKNQCNCNACGCGGTINCQGQCSGAPPTIPSNHGEGCNCNSCGQCGGTWLCNGVCWPGSTPPNPPGYGTQCNPNACNQYGGTIQCNGQCSGPAPPNPPGYGTQCNPNACNQYGGTIQCNGQCSGPAPPNPPGYGNPCNRNSCGGTGTIKCDGSCSASPPPCACDGCVSNCNQACGSCGGSVKCDGSCNIPNPPNYGQSCGSCGGTIRCDGTCSVATPSNYGQACNRNACGGTGTIKCDGSCSAPAITPCDCTPGSTQPCGKCGTQTCGSDNKWGTCTGEGACSSGQTESQTCGFGGTQTRTCQSNCQWGIYGNCENQGECNPGDPPQTRPCGNCGQQIRTCQTNNQWGQWGACRQGACIPGATQCSGTRYQTCNSNCAWTLSGTDADSDLTDLQCGDSICDNAAGVYDSTKTVTETACTDGTDNDCDGKKDCLDSDCNGAPNCCTIIKRDCKAMTENQFKDMHRKCYDDTTNEPSWCSIISQKIAQHTDPSTGTISTTYHSCKPDDNDNVCCTNANSCVYNGQCYPNGYRKDWDGDNIIERCVVQSPGQWVNEFEVDCGNGIDDDFDALIDCEDTDCNGWVNGTVKNQESQFVPQADITIKKDTTTIGTGITNQQGDYSIGIKCGTYSATASHSNYVPQTKTNVNVPGRSYAIANFNLIKGTSCESDCTFAADNTIHASCDGKNGCGFYDDTAKAVCELAQPGWARDYNSTHYIICPSGVPQVKIFVQASVSCSSGTLIKVTRIVTYNGKPVKLVVASCG